VRRCATLRLRICMHTSGRSRCSCFSTDLQQLSPLTDPSSGMKRCPSPHATIISPSTSSGSESRAAMQSSSCEPTMAALGSTRLGRTLRLLLRTVYNAVHRRARPQGIFFAWIAMTRDVDPRTPSRHRIDLAGLLPTASCKLAVAGCSEGVLSGQPMCVT